MKTPAPQIKLSPKGVFITEGDDRETRIAAPINCEAYGTRVDGTKVARISFVDYDGNRLTEIINLSSFLPKNVNDTADTFANKGYRWPRDKRRIEAILAALAEHVPERRFKLVGAPGWYEGIYVTPDREYGSEHPEHRSFVIDPLSGAKVAPFVHGPGSLKGWKTKVAKVARNSSCLRLCIAAAFAAPILRPLGLDSFGLNVFEETSVGKTTCLHVAASVSGQIGKRGLPGWGDSDAAVEQSMVGHRDGLLPLDETSDGNAKTISLASKARTLAFAIGRNRPRNLDKGHEKRSNLSAQDCRNIVLSSSERALGAIAMGEGAPRLGGEEVRLIDVPASEPGSQGIFDKALKPDADEAPMKVAQGTVDKLRTDAAANQGYALHEFLRHYVKDRKALETLKEYKNKFERSVETAMLQNSDRRIASNFAAMAAAADLAIDYGILPWKKKPTRKAIRKCLIAALAAKLRPPTPNKVASTTNLAALKESLDRLDLIKIKKGERPTSEDAARREQADGYRVGHEIYVKPKRWNGITAANKAILIQQKVLRTERPDVITMARKVGGVPGKLRYIVINSIALDEAIARST